MEHILDINISNPTLEYIFERIRQRKTILFLGSGSSVSSEKKYLGIDVIDYYETIKSKKYGTQDLIEFVDILNSTKDFNRPEFDTYVHGLVKNLNFEDFHKKLISILWYKIITTNFDLVIEKAFDSIDSTKRDFELKVIRNKKELNYSASNNEMLYIKLNGCV